MSGPFRTLYFLVCVSLCWGVHAYVGCLQSLEESPGPLELGLQAAVSHLMWGPCPSWELTSGLLQSTEWCVALSLQPSSPPGESVVDALRCSTLFPPLTRPPRQAVQGEPTYIMLALCMCTCVSVCLCAYLCTYAMPFSELRTVMGLFRVKSMP